MIVLNKVAQGKYPARMSGEEKTVVETGGKNADFTDRDTTQPLVVYVKERCAAK